MGKSGQCCFWNLVIWCLLLQTTTSRDLGGSEFSQASGRVQLIQQQEHVVMTNGIVNVTLTVPGGMLTSITYRGSDNLLQTQLQEDSRGYWDLVWNKPGLPDNMDKLAGTSFQLITKNENQTEISFVKKWTSASPFVPLNVDKRFVMLKDSPGFYTYTVLERLKGFPAFDIQEGRIAIKLEENKFHYMAMSDERQRIMPMPEDRNNVSSQPLNYKEAVLLTNPANVQLKGEVDDKYFYMCDNKDNKVHGWVSNDDTPLGFWMITPSNEFKTGGPFKQDLTSHVGPVTLSMFISTHYVGEDITIKFQAEDYWKKVLGPVYVYLNSNVSAKANPTVLWDDAKQRAQKEEASWPYNFPLSGEFLKSNQRGAVTGQLFIHDRFSNKNAVPAGGSAYVGLAPPGAAGSWQLGNKGYQFWTQTDKNGTFSIKNVIPGTYSLFAYVPGYIGDYKHASNITVAPGKTVNATNVVFEPPRNGPTLWEIGVPDRTAAEFFIPDPSPTFKVHNYSKPVEKFRQYGLWARYADKYPQSDLVYTVGQSDYTKDWFFAHVTRNLGNNTYASTTWRIEFDLKNVNRGAANYTLQIALASANQAELQVRFNDPKSAPHFMTTLIGRDNAIARHGAHGLYRLYSVGVSGKQLVDGKNVIFLTQARGQGTFVGIMYDYIRFEAPAHHR